MTEEKRRHDSPLFTTSGLEEWLVYCSVSWKSFVVSIVNGDQSYTGQGQYALSGPKEFSFSLSGFGNQIDMTFEQEPTASRRRKFFGTAPLVSSFLLDQQQVGECRVNNGYGEDDPVIQLRSKRLGVALQVLRHHPSLVYCPLLLCGSDYWQGVFEEYVMMEISRRRLLPKVRHPADFLGSLRKTKFALSLLPVSYKLLRPS